MKYSEVYEKGEDNGWLKKQNFWFDPEHEHGFAIQDLDSIYPEKYFETDHVKPETIEAYCRLIPDFFEKITGEKLTNIIEVGTAGGWFGEQFRKQGIFSKGVEGSSDGYLKSSKRGGYSQLIAWDLRRSIPQSFNNNNQIALCTEVAEHIEPPFSSVLVKSLCDASDLVWFSFEEPNTNPAHIHHPNEMPAKFWINLFEFYGYGAYKLPQWVYDQCEGRGMYIMYNKKTYEGNQFLQQQH